MSTLTIQIPESLARQLRECAAKEGVTVDLSQIKPENLEELIDQLDDVTVDVGHENHRAKVMVFLLGKDGARAPSL